MAIYHLSLKAVSRSSGRSPVAAAAYRAGARLYNARDNLVHDFRGKAGVVRAGILLPAGVEAPWAEDRAALWNAADAAEARRDAKTAQEFEVALPDELDGPARERLVRDFAQVLADEYRAAADWAIHAPPGEGDGRNHHAHILLTVREVGPEGLGAKIALGREHAWLRRAGLASSREQLCDLRGRWADLSNGALARAGHDARVDHRSHEARGLSLAPTTHVGVHAVQMARRGLGVVRQALSRRDSDWNARVIGAAPEEILALIADAKSVFGRADIEAAVGRAVTGDGAARAQALAAVMGSRSLVRVAGDDGGRRAPLYTTRRMIALEAEMSRLAGGLQGARDHGVARDLCAAAIRNTWRVLVRTGTGAGLSDEQAAAVYHVTGSGGLAVVTGRAGAGKSTMLRTAREAWEAGGYRVLGAALAGKAADGLEDASGIEARTLGAWSWRWERGQALLGPRDVLVVDEAGMLGTAQLSALLREVHGRGAKVVLVGDEEQLQPIGAGAPFRAAAELCGSVSLEGIYRQRADWQRAATAQFAAHETGAGVAAYADRNHVVWRADQNAAGLALAAGYGLDVQADPSASRLALAHRRRDVVMLNGLIRAALRELGLLSGTDREVRTSVGARAFTEGDRVMFLANDSRLGVRNGGLGVVTALEDGVIAVRPDGRGESVRLDTRTRPALDHGYAATVHKAQGATVERAFVLAGAGMDRHLAYVAMTRHRGAVTLYASEDEFGGMAGLVKRLSRPGLAQNVRDVEDGFLARRGFSAGAVRRIAGLARGLLRAMETPVVPSLRQAFLKFPPPVPVVTFPEPGRAATAQHKKMLAGELARAEAQLRPRDPAYLAEQARLEQQEKNARERARERERGWGREMELERSLYPERGFGMEW